MSLNADADRLYAQYLQELPCSVGEEDTTFRLKFYERLITTKGMTTDNKHLTQEYKISYQKLIDLYKQRKLDGTKSTYVCQGKVIKSENGEDLPPHTIHDGHAQFQAYGGMNAQGFQNHPRSPRARCSGDGRVTYNGVKDERE